MFRSLYLTRQTVIHQLDPRTKIISAVILSAMVFIFNNPLYLGVIALGLVALGVVAQAMRNYLRVRYFLLVSVIVPFVVWQFYFKGPTVIGHVGTFAVSKEALLFGLAAGMRYLSLVMVGTLFASTVAVEDFMLGLVRLRISYRVAFVFSLAARLVPTFAFALATIVEAQVARGLDLETRNPIRRAKSLVPLVVPFLVYAVRYGFLLSMALESKGFSPEAKRTYLRELRMKTRDYLVLSSMLALTLTFLVLRLNGFGAVLPGRM